MKRKVFTNLFLVMIVLTLNACEQRAVTIKKTNKEPIWSLKVDYSELPKIKLIDGLSVEKVQELQAKTAKALNINVAFREAFFSGEGKKNFSPTMVVIPAGSYEMGCTVKTDEVCFPRQRARITVTHKWPFAVSETEITQADWLFCVEDGFCNENIEMGSSLNGNTADLAIVGVNWFDSQTYVNWLSEKTGHSYRLLSESEWEYSAKAGSNNTYNLGNTVNCTKPEYKKASSNACYYMPNSFHREVGPIKQRQANAFGLYDMHGNAWEFVEDCWSNSLLNVSSDGNPYELKKSKDNMNLRCSNFIVKGGAFAGIFKRLRASHHSMGRKSETYNDQGLRIARDLF